MSPKVRGGQRRLGKALGGRRRLREGQETLGEVGEGWTKIRGDGLGIRRVRKRSSDVGKGHDRLAEFRKGLVIKVGRDSLDFES